MESTVNDIMIRVSLLLDRKGVEAVKNGEKVLDKLNSKIDKVSRGTGKHQNALDKVADTVEKMDVRANKAGISLGNAKGALDGLKSSTGPVEAAKNLKILAGEAKGVINVMRNLNNSQETFNLLAKGFGPTAARYAFRLGGIASWAWKASGAMRLLTGATALFNGAMAGLAAVGIGAVGILAAATAGAVVIAAALGGIWYYRNRNNEAIARGNLLEKERLRLIDQRIARQHKLNDANARFDQATGRIAGSRASRLQGLGRFDESETVLRRQLDQLKSRMPGMDSQILALKQGLTVKQAGMKLANNRAQQADVKEWQKGGVSMGRSFGDFRESMAKLDTLKKEEILLKSQVTIGDDLLRASKAKESLLNAQLQTQEKIGGSLLQSLRAKKDMITAENQHADAKLRTVEAARNALLSMQDEQTRFDAKIARMNPGQRKTLLKTIEKTKEDPTNPRHWKMLEKLNGVSDYSNQGLAATAGDTSAFSVLKQNQGKQTEEMTKIFEELAKEGVEKNLKAVNLMKDTLVAFFHSQAAVNDAITQEAAAAAELNHTVASKTEEQSLEIQQNIWEIQSNQ